jgi:hypothetical protein
MNRIGKKSKMKLFLVVLLLTGPLRCLNAENVASSSAESECKQVAALKYLGRALNDRGGVARIDYVTASAAKDGTPFPFPAVIERNVRPSGGSRNL